MQVVSVHGDIDGAQLDAHFPDLLDESGEVPGDGNSARRDADERDVGEGGIALDDFVRDPADGALDGLGVEQKLGGG